MHVGLILPVGAVARPGVPRGYADVRSLALLAESAGLDSVWVYDHLLGDSIDDAAGSPWEAWTVLSALAEATSRVRLGTLVMCTSFRPPGVLARMADTLQEVSGGRLVLGVGAGWHEPEYTAFGLPFDHRVTRFEESLEVLTQMLRTGRASVSGRHHQVDRAPIRLRPDRPVPPILVAALRPRMLRLAATYADQWNLAWFGLPGETYREANAALTTACTEVGRDPATLARTAGMRVVAHSADDPTPDPRRAVRGDVDEVAEAFRVWQDEGISELVCWPDPSEPAMVELLAEAYRKFKQSG
jgi:alkanesulfonate monooxygenase SsuD/methylene tetrahydromethanopterin reductase-like flavin-dependent oxidoreductase (luciferase family)